MRVTSQPRTIVASLAAVGTLVAGFAVVAATDTDDPGNITVATEHSEESTNPAPPNASDQSLTGSNEHDADPANADNSANHSEPDDTTAPLESGDPDIEPTEFVDTEPLDGPPGVITGNDDIDTDPPPLPPPTMDVAHLVAVAKPPPTSPPTVDPIDILEVGGNGPDIPAVVITEFAVPVDNSIGDIAPSVTGCALQCVSTAILTPNMTTPNVGLNVETRVPARIDIALTNTANGDESLFTSNGFKLQWSTTLTPLVADTEYDLVLEAFDQQGQRRVHTHTFTTTTPLDLPGLFQDNTPGCAGTCITKATVSPTDRADEVRVDIETNTLASVKVWMSTSEPGSVDGTPFLPADAIVEPTLGIRKDWSVEKAFLDLETTYHIIVRAEDDNGVDYQVGEFTTGPPPPVNVRLTFEQIFVQWDGDPHWGGLDRGELSFAWGLYDGDLNYDFDNGWEDRVGFRSEEKMYGGEDVLLHSNNEIWQTLDQDDVFLSPGVTATEYDDPPGMQFGGNGTPMLVERPVDMGLSGRMNPAWGPHLTLAEIKAQQTCGEMGFVHTSPDDYCVSFTTQHLDDKEFPNIQVIVSYHIDT